MGVLTIWPELCSPVKIRTDPGSQSPEWELFLSGISCSFSDTGCPFLGDLPISLRAEQIPKREADSPSKVLLRNEGVWGETG